MLLELFSPNNSVNEVIHRNFWRQQIWTKHCSVGGHSLIILCTLMVFWTWPSSKGVLPVKRRGYLPFFVGPQPMNSITSTWLKWRLKFFNAIFNFHTHCSNVMASLYAIGIILPQHDLNNSVNEVMHRNFWHQQIWTWTIKIAPCVDNT